MTSKANQATVDALSALLASSYTLYVKTHNYHWNVTGPMFSALHAMFELQYTDMARSFDEIAERARKVLACVSEPMRLRMAETRAERSSSAVFCVSITPILERTMSRGRASSEISRCTIWLMSRPEISPMPDESVPMRVPPRKPIGDAQALQPVARYADVVSVRGEARFIPRGAERSKLRREMRLRYASRPWPTNPLTKPGSPSLSDSPAWS